MKTLYFIFHQGNILLRLLPDNTYTIPTDCSLLQSLVPTDSPLHVETSLTDNQVYTFETDSDTQPEGYCWTGLRPSYYHLTPHLYQTAGKCEELLHWSRNNRYCGACGHPMHFHTAISKKCEYCGKEIWPSPAPAIIVLIHRGEEVLLVHARNFRSNFFGLVAGFVETGESLEEAVVREVREETGLSITNLRYFSSQPWPYPCGIMIGFHADYESGTLKLQDEELEAGAWFTKDHLPTIPEKLSIARRLIDAWLGED